MRLVSARNAPRKAGIVWNTRQSKLAAAHRATPLNSIHNRRLSSPRRIVPVGIAQLKPPGAGIASVTAMAWATAFLMCPLHCGRLQNCCAILIGDNTSKGRQASPYNGDEQGRMM